MRGNCMRPVLAPGDIVFVTKKRFYLPGDILVFQGIRQTMIAHRLLGYVVTPRGLQVMTKADNGDQPDSLVQLKNIIGKITRIAPHAESLRISPWKRLRALYDLHKCGLRSLNKKASLHMIKLQRFIEPKLSDFLTRSAPIYCPARVFDNPRHIHGYACGCRKPL